MSTAEAPSVSALIEQIITSLEYYNERAKTSEINKYRPHCLIELMREFPDAVLIADDNGKCVGFCVSDYDDGVIWLAWFGVAATYRRQGIGRALLAALEERARNRGIHKIWCDCRTTNRASQQVLADTGFTVICEVKNHWYGQDFLLLEQLLT
jgi:ribosomal protein S18 acetylase RimI-like enzyme